MGENEAVQRPLARLAQELDLEGRELTVSGRSGHRTIFGCASALRHILSPERSSLTLASDADLSQRWINVLQLELARDWTWDDLAEEGLTVQRRLSRPGQPDEIAGTISLPRALTPAMLDGVGDTARDPQRAFSRIVLFDAVDPKPAPGEFPTELTVSYEIAATLRDELPSPDIVQASILLPITTPPVQVPHLVSAGIALTPHEPAEDYSATNQRERMLWLEFDALPNDPQDTYFVRVLAAAADPLLTERPLRKSSPNLPCRWMTNGCARSLPGNRAMTMASAPCSHCCAARTTARTSSFRCPMASMQFAGAVRHVHLRGPARPHRRTLVNGARTFRTAAACCRRAASATAARLPGRARPRNPCARGLCDAGPGRSPRSVPSCQRPELWALLYARVEQADAAAWRNLLLLRTPLLPPFATRDSLHREKPAAAASTARAIFRSRKFAEFCSAVGWPTPRHSPRSSRSSTRNLRSKTRSARASGMRACYASRLSFPFRTHVSDGRARQRIRCPNEQLLVSAQQCGGYYERLMQDTL